MPLDAFLSSLQEASDYPRLINRCVEFLETESAAELEAAHLNPSIGRIIDALKTLKDEEKFIKLLTHKAFREAFNHHYIDVIYHKIDSKKGHQKAYRLFLQYPDLVSKPHHHTLIYSGQYLNPDEFKTLLENKNFLAVVLPDLNYPHGCKALSVWQSDNIQAFFLAIFNKPKFSSWFSRLLPWLTFEDQQQLLQNREMFMTLTPRQITALASESTLSLTQAFLTHTDLLAPLKIETISLLLTNLDDSDADVFSAMLNNANIQAKYDTKTIAPLLKTLSKAQVNQLISHPKWQAKMPVDCIMELIETDKIDAKAASPLLHSSAFAKRITNETLASPLSNKVKTQFFINPEIQIKWLINRVNDEKWNDRGWGLFRNHTPSHINKMRHEIKIMTANETTSSAQIILRVKEIADTALSSRGCLINTRHHETQAFYLELSQLETRHLEKKATPPKLA